MLCVLMLRGPQTPGELKQRTDRLHPFADLAAIEDTLLALIDRELVRRLERRPGQKEQRYEQLLGGAEAPRWRPRCRRADPDPDPAAPAPGAAMTAWRAWRPRWRACASELDDLKTELGQ